MRISDWSSDVCSSDLPLVRDEPKELKAARGRAVGPVVNAMLRDLCAAYALLDSVSSLIGRKVLTGESWRCDDRKSCHGDRSEERRGGKEGVSTCRSGWSPDHEKKKEKIEIKEGKRERRRKNK